MLILETERRSSPFIVDRTIIGHRPSLLKSATGRAYLAFCPDEERRHLLDVLRKSGHPDDSLANIPRLIDRIIDETRRNGYGVRELARRTRISDKERDFNAIAVPVIVRKRVVACINALWIEHVMGIEDFAALYLPALRDATSSLARAIMRQANNPVLGTNEALTKSARTEKP
jgi:IclR family mhp operon transcriptional activator